MPAKLSREDYALRYGPTTGDLVRLGDTDLWIRVERDDVAYGDELTYGWGRPSAPAWPSRDRLHPANSTS